MSVEYNASEQFYNASKCEYDYELNRNTMLDNKVSMTLAFCGVVLLFLINYLDIRSLWVLSTPHQCWECILRFVCSALQVLCLAFFAVCIIKLFVVLKPKAYCCLDTNFLLKETLPEWNAKQAYMYLGVKYTEFTAFNRAVNEKRSKGYSSAILWLLLSIACCVINELIKYNFLMEV